MEQTSGCPTAQCALAATGYCLVFVVVLGVLGVKETRMPQTRNALQEGGGGRNFKSCLCYSPGMGRKLCLVTAVAALLLVAVVVVVVCFRFFPGPCHYLLSCPLSCFQSCPLTILCRPLGRLM
jgi:hypothetical protein